MGERWFGTAKILIWPGLSKPGERGKRQDFEQEGKEGEEV